MLRTEDRTHLADEHEARSQAIEIRALLKNMLSKIPREYPCCFGCLSVLLGGIIAGIAGGVLFGEQGAAIMLVVFGLLAGIAGYFLSRRRDSKRTARLHSEMDALVSQACDKHPILKKYLADVSDILEPATWDEIITLLGNDVRQTQQKVISDFGASDIESALAGLSLMVDEESRKSAALAHQSLFPGCSGCLIAPVGLGVALVIVALFFDDSPESGALFILSLPIVFGTAAYLLARRFAARVRQESHRELCSFAQALCDKHPVIAEAVANSGELLKADRRDELIKTLQASLIQRQQALVEPGAERRSDSLFREHSLRERTLYRIEVFEKDPDPVMPQICVIMGDKPDFEMPISGYLWSPILTIPPYFILWSQRCDTVMLPFSKRGYELYRNTMPKLYEFVDAGFKVCSCIPLLPVDILWWAVSLFLRIFDVSSGEKRRLCVVHWQKTKSLKRFRVMNKGARKFSISVTSAEFALEFKRLNPWCEVYEIESNKAKMFPF